MTGVQTCALPISHVADFIQSRTYRAFETYFAVMVIYLGMALLLRWAFHRAGRRLFAGRS